MKKKVLISLLLVITILTAIFSTVYATDEQTEIPNKYDLRNDINIRIENQKDKPWCSRYAYVKMVETYLQKTKGLNYNLSEGYLNYSLNLGNSFMSGEYVLEDDFPNIEYPVTEANTKKFNEATEKAVIKNVELYLNDIDNNKIKEYIMKYGSIELSIFNTDNQWNNYKGGIYHKDMGNISQAKKHAVSIIGWDDNYSRNNFVYEKPEKDGAWLVLNSWGTNWGNNGTAWLSYEDYFGVKGTLISLIGSLTLSDGEIIETKLEDKKQEEIKKTEIPVIEQETIEPTKTNNMQNIFIIVFAVAVILLIIGIILKSKKHK